jgi:hypothetical protein
MPKHQPNTYMLKNPETGTRYRLTVDLGQDAYDRISEYARANGVTRSTMLRMACLAYCKMVDRIFTEKGMVTAANLKD